jgi:hypothetical protein
MHSSTIERGTGFSKSRRFLTALVVESSSSVIAKSKSIFASFQVIFLKIIAQQ